LLPYAPVSFIETTLEKTPYKLVSCCALEITVKIYGTIEVVLVVFDSLKLSRKK